MYDWFTLYERGERLGDALAEALRALLAHRECPTASPEANQAAEAVKAWEYRMKTAT